MNPLCRDAQTARFNALLLTVREREREVDLDCIRFGHTHYTARRAHTHVDDCRLFTARTHFISKASFAILRYAAHSQGVKSSRSLLAPPVVLRYIGEARSAQCVI